MHGHTPFGRGFWRGWGDKVTGQGLRHPSKLNYAFDLISQKKGKGDDVLLYTK